MTALSDLPADVDLLVIGGGTAGLIAAKTAAGFGATALLVEAHRMGGDCLWTGCVPSKSLIAAAEAAHSAGASHALGVSAGTTEVDFAAVLAHVHGAIHEIESVDSVEATEAAGALATIGRTRFTGPRSAEIDGRAISLRQAVIATGSSPEVSDLPGIDGIDVLTSDSVWELTARPERLVVLGGGAIGCELGRAFARFGSHVALVQRTARLLPKEDSDASAIVADALVADGVDVRVATTVERVEGADDRLSGILICRQATACPSIGSSWRSDAAPARPASDSTPRACAPTSADTSSSTTPCGRATGASSPRAT